MICGSSAGMGHASRTKGVADDVDAKRTTHKSKRTTLPALFRNAGERIGRLDSDRRLEHALLLVGLGLQELRGHVANWPRKRWTIQGLAPAVGEREESPVGLFRSPRAGGRALSDDGRALADDRDHRLASPGVALSDRRITPRARISASYWPQPVVRLASVRQVQSHSGPRRSRAILFSSRMVASICLFPASPTI